MNPSKEKVMLVLLLRLNFGYRDKCFCRDVTSYEVNVASVFLYSSPNSLSGEVN